MAKTHAQTEKKIDKNLNDASSKYKQNSKKKTRHVEQIKSNLLGVEFICCALCSVIRRKFHVKFPRERLIRNLKIRFVSKVQPNLMRIKTLLFNSMLAYIRILPNAKFRPDARNRIEIHANICRVVVN